jgi:predicted nucleic-acid-binding protein
MMIGLDTNVLARYYIFDANDAEALRQRPLAQGLIDSTQALVVCKTVIIEFEWLMRRHYKMKRAAILAIFQHVQSLPNLTIEDRPSFTQALANYKLGIAFADALHHASYTICNSIASFDDRTFARRARTLALHPPVFVPR